MSTHQLLKEREHVCSSRPWSWLLQGLVAVSSWSVVVPSSSISVHGRNAPDGSLTLPSLEIPSGGIPHGTNGGITSYGNIDDRLQFLYYSVCGLKFPALQALGEMH